MIRPLLALLLVAGPAFGAAGTDPDWPCIQRKQGGHLAAAGCIVALVLGGPLGFPAWVDGLLLVGFGATISFQILCFALLRSLVRPEEAGRALSAQNIFFFGGAAVLQGLSGAAAALGGVAAALLTFVGAALVALYTGAEVAVVQARPLWNTPLLPLQFFVTAFAGAVGLALLFNRFGPNDETANRRMAGVLAASQVAALAVGALWLTLGVSGIAPVHAQALAEVGPSANWQLSAVWAVAATVLTLVLAWKVPGSGLLIGLLALHSAWMMRWSIFIGGQEVPKTGAGYYTYSLPLGPEGLMGIVGTAGLWVFLFVLITTLLPLDRLAAGDTDKAAA